MNRNRKLRPILLAGGSGSRLWPLSTKERPKQFIPIFKEFSLFDLSLQRLNNPSLFKKPIIVTSYKYIKYIEESILRTGVEVEKIILEPEAKNTLPAISLAIKLAIIKDPQENFLIAPSDHYMSFNMNFYDACMQAKPQLKSDGLILMGVRPERPSSEYGYISLELNNKTINPVKSFIEKPDLESSKKLIKRPGVFWNAGIFIFNGGWFLKELEKQDYKTSSLISRLIEISPSKNNKFFPDESLFSKLQSISFDKGFVEKGVKASMVELNAGWSDLGSWVSLSKLQKDPESDMTLYDDGSYKKTIKPWGFFEVLMEDDKSKVKLLSIYPGQRISLQKHKYRSETWHIINGEANIVKGKENLILHSGESVFIEKNQLHRLENKTKDALQIIEVQSGTYFGEDDIIRIKDSYGRAGLH